MIYPTIPPIIMHDIPTICQTIVPINELFVTIIVIISYNKPIIKPITKPSNAPIIILNIYSFIGFIELLSPDIYLI